MRLLIGVAFGLAFAAVGWGALAIGLAVIPGVPQTAIEAATGCCLASVAGAAAAVTAARKRPPRAQLAERPAEPPRRQLAAEPRDYLTMQMPGPDRPSADRPTPGLTWQCPVRPGKPRTVRDLHRKPPRDLRSWE